MDLVDDVDIMTAQRKQSGLDLISMAGYPSVVHAQNVTFLMAGVLHSRDWHSVWPERTLFASVSEVQSARVISHDMEIDRVGPEYQDVAKRGSPVFDVPIGVLFVQMSGKNP